MSLRKKLDAGKEALDVKLMNARMNAEAQALMSFYAKIAKEDGITIEEAIQLCDTVPKYSLGRKIQIYMIRAGTDIRHKDDHFNEFISSLTDEEREIYEFEVKPMNLMQMVRKEGRKAKKYNL